MEKISNIVRGNPRVASVDLKSAAPVRPGAPGFGRPVGESAGAFPKSMSTSDRALALHKEMSEAKLANTHQTLVQNMADKFFMDRMRGSQAEEQVEVSAPEMERPPLLEVHVPLLTAPSEDGDSADEGTDVAPPPQKYTPRGSFIDVRV